MGVDSVAYHSATLSDFANAEGSPVPSAADELAAEELAVKSSLEMFNRLRRENHRLKREFDDLRDGTNDLRREAEDRHRAEVSALKATIAALEATVEALQSERASMDSRIASANIDRDVAKDNEAIWRAFFAGVRAQFDAFEVPQRPSAVAAG